MESVAAKRLVLVALVTSLCGALCLSALTFTLGEFEDAAGQFRVMGVLMAFTIVAVPVGILGAFVTANFLNLVGAVVLPDARRPLEELPRPVEEMPADDETVFRFRCTLDRYPDALPFSTAYRPVAGHAPVVECRLPARRYEDAVARAVRELEECGASVLESNRLGPA